LLVNQNSGKDVARIVAYPKRSQKVKSDSNKYW